MLPMASLQKLAKGDKVAIVSPSFAAPGRWPHVHALGLKRLREDFGLEPVEYPTTAKIGASGEERSRDLIRAFEDPEIHGVIASLGGDDQITYVKHLPCAPFADNPKPFFGYSDNTHMANFLWLRGIPSFYGGALFTQFAMNVRMEALTVRYLRHALFESGEIELEASDTYNDIGLGWDDPENLKKHRQYEPNEGWLWDGTESGEGVTWGGCIESIDELLRHGVTIPSLADFENVVLIGETSEEIPPAAYVLRVFRALGERGILERIKGVLIGRPKAWEFDKQANAAQKAEYRKEQRDGILREVRKYNPTVPVVQNLDFGHTNPQIAMPYGGRVRIDAGAKRVFAEF